MFDGKVYEEGNAQQQFIAKGFYEGIDFSGKTVLDCGCGDGSVTNLVAGKAKKLIAFDVSDSQITTARNKITNEEKEFIVCGFESMMEQPSIVQNTFDFIISNFALHFCGSLTTYFENVFKLLKVKGELICQWPQSPHYLGPVLMQLKEKYGKYLDQSEAKIDVLQTNGVSVDNHKDFFPTTLVACASALFQAGFRREDSIVEEQLITYEYKSREHMKKFLAGINVFRSVIPSEMIAEFDEDVVDLFLKGPYCQNVGVDNPYAQHLVIMKVRAIKK